MAILIVESSPQSRDHLTSLLGAEGYTEVVTAESARHAFQYLGLEDPAQAAGDVDLILLDMGIPDRSEEHTSELQSLAYLVCRLLLEKKKKMRHIAHAYEQDSKYNILQA